MNIKTATSLIAGTSLLIAAAPGFAATIDGITFPTDPGQHVFAGTISEDTVTNLGEELFGNGTINSVNGQSNGFCESGACELTYEFGGYTLEDITKPEDAANGRGKANFSGGYVNFYANGDRDHPWLTTVADPEENSKYTLEGTLTNTGSLSQNTAVGLLSVTGGSAASIFDNDTYENSAGGLSDLLFNISASPSNGDGDMTFQGSVDAHYVSGNASNVPEPSGLALLGLGMSLVGFGATYRRRKSA